MASDENHYIVGMGASAGGLQALQNFFPNVKEDPEASFIVVMHSMRDYKSNLAHILSKSTKLKVQEIIAGDPIEINRVYIAPPHSKVDIINRKFMLTERSAIEVINNTINHFFISLSENIGDKAIGIIMSGTGGDGTDGAHSIEQHGGIVLVQDPSTSQFNGMPNHSIKYDHPDYVLAPQKMPALIDLIIANKEDKSRRRQRTLSSYY